MKASLSWMAKLTQSEPIKQEDLVTRIGAQLGEIEQVVNLGQIYQDALIVKVVKAVPLEGSDHLKVCLIDDKAMHQEVNREPNGLIQVVCGANNVNEGQIVVWLPPGAVVPSSINKEPLKLAARKILNVTSNGMIASARELAISDDHQGIVVLPDNIDYPQLLADYLFLSDQIIDIENKMFTHRPDLFGQLGIAREINGIYGKAFKSPDWYDANRELPTGKGVDLIVNNLLKDNGCPRFMAVAIDQIHIEPSPLWMQSYLSRCGIRPLNNIIDITNYVMLATGQPLHAYDRERSGSTINVRLAKSGEKLQLIDGRNIELKSKDIVIASSESVLGLAGIMGGKESEVAETTTKILLECANFDMYSIRRSAMEHGIASEAVTRFTKQISPYSCQPALAYACQLISELCQGAQVVSEAVDDFISLSPPQPVRLPLARLNSYLGTEFNPALAVSLLTNVEMEANLNNSDLEVKPPFWRTDLLQAEDIIEEIARLYGYDRLPKKLPSRSVSPPKIPKLTKLKQNIRRKLVSSGFNELLTYSFVNERLIHSANQDSDQAFALINAISPELGYYRMSLMPSLLNKVHANIKAGYGRFGLFEIGKAHRADLFDQKKLPQERELVAAVISADGKVPKLLNEPIAYFEAKHYLEMLINSLGIDGTKLLFDSKVSQDDWLSQAVRPYLPGRCAVVKLNDKLLGIIGEFLPSVASVLKLPPYCAGFELDLNILIDCVTSQPEIYTPLSSYPKVIQDLTLALDKDNTYYQLFESLTSSLNKIKPEDYSFSLLPIDAYQKDQSHPVNWTFRLSVGSDKRTLTDREVSDLVDQLKGLI